MEKNQAIHIGLSVNYAPGKLRKDYKPIISKILSKNDYRLDEIRLFSDRIEMSLSGPPKPPNLIEQELTNLGSLIENEITISALQKCFILMPFNKKDLDVVYNDFLKPSIEKLKLQCIRGDDIFGDNIIMDDIIKLIKESAILVADLTYRNPNVFYELGLAHAFGKKVLLLAQSMDDVPFDLRHRRVCLYKYSPKGCKKLENEMVAHIETLLTESEKSLPKEKNRPKKSERKSVYYESFCDNFFWEKLEKIGDGDIEYDDEQNEILASGMFTYLLSNKTFGKNKLIIKTKLIFENFSRFKDDGSETANSGIVFAWSKNEGGSNYLNLLFNGKRVLLEEVGYRSGEHFYDFKHLDAGAEFSILDGKEYGIILQIQMKRLDVFIDQKWIYSKELLKEPIGKVGFRPWRAKLRCKQFEVEETKS
jgi:hypothetical protein